MQLFNIIAGVASIASLIISLVNFSNIIKIKTTINVDESVKSKQNLKANNITQSDIKQAGRDVR